MAIKGYEITYKHTGSKRKAEVHQEEREANKRTRREDRSTKCHYFALLFTQRLITVSDL